MICLQMLEMLSLWSVGTLNTRTVREGKQKKTKRKWALDNSTPKTACNWYPTAYLHIKIWKIRYTIITHFEQKLKRLPPLQKACEDRCGPGSVEIFHRMCSEGEEEQKSEDGTKIQVTRPLHLCTPQAETIDHPQENPTSKWLYIGNFKKW